MFGLPAGLLQPLNVLEWNWENVSTDFIIGLPRTLKSYTVIWVVVNRLTKSAHFIARKSTYTAILERTLDCLGHEIRFQHNLSSSDRWSNRAFESNFRGYAMVLCSRVYRECCISFMCWGEVGKRRMLGPELVQTTNKAIQKIRARMLTAQSKQKSYSDERCKDLEFNIGDMVFLKIGPVVYHLALPPSFSIVHDVFYVSMLNRLSPLKPSHSLSFPSSFIVRKVSILLHSTPLVPLLRFADLSSVVPPLNVALVCSHSSRFADLFLVIPPLSAASPHASKPSLSRACQPPSRERVVCSLREPRPISSCKPSHPSRFPLVEPST
ncbi:DNA/RNA polymerases superfamily protein [Cucumis melo var. makuwa]|uniref:DNA/RNA polymerases superfamily protein n=1 Tax=Cucumis melo var. makuwa TaxID=1194695 RepID=A0A5D3DBS3_CUCMM|nr:DNA/RNA polymerases superfamily protein [Cucumis melo var. makuwa]TYK21016.1 DNA/RNA polymerases superfamily protein [Cucumis melo var. makuwa]